MRRSHHSRLASAQTEEPELALAKQAPFLPNPLHENALSATKIRGFVLSCCRTSSTFLRLSCFPKSCAADKPLQSNDQLSFRNGTRLRRGLLPHGVRASAKRGYHERQSTTTADSGRCSRDHDRYSGCLAFTSQVLRSSPRPQAKLCRKTDREREREGDRPEAKAAKTLYSETCRQLVDFQAQVRFLQRWSLDTTQATRWLPQLGVMVLLHRCQGTVLASLSLSDVVPAWPTTLSGA